MHVHCGFLLHQVEERNKVLAFMSPHSLLSKAIGSPFLAFSLTSGFIAVGKPCSNGLAGVSE